MACLGPKSIDELLLNTEIVIKILEILKLKEIPPQLLTITCWTIGNLARNIKMPQFDKVNNLMQYY